MDRIEFSLVDRVREALGLPRSAAVGARAGDGDDASEPRRGLCRKAAIASVSRWAMPAMAVRAAGSSGEDGLAGRWLGDPVTGVRKCLSRVEPGEVDPERGSPKPSPIGVTSSSGVALPAAAVSIGGALRIALARFLRARSCCL